jgi:hypothetical protein
MSGLHSVDGSANPPARHTAQVRLELMAGEQADAIAEAVIQRTPTATVQRLPGLVNISAPGTLSFSCADVSEQLGCSWDTRQLQVIMANYAGYISRMDEDGVELTWHEIAASDHTPPRE